MDTTITKQAQEDSAKDPKRSAPIPATSPTLSPAEHFRKVKLRLTI